ncbi:MAG: ATP-dependent DNA helicase UvrD2 [Gordonia sp. (in: high G+C Gram-positive bacteria)]
MTAIHEGLDPEQLEAVLAPRGPVCVLAGAGTGKTRTITRRIAHLIESGQVNPGQVLAVTFTARAAAEMRERLEALGAADAGERVAAQTFHAAALRQLRYFWPSVMGQAQWRLMDNKYPMVRRAASSLGLDTGDRDLIRDLAGEIEWAKSCTYGAADYARAVAEHRRDAPVDPKTVAAVFTAYEDGKVSPEGDRLLDFEDLILYTTMILRSERAVSEEFRSRYRSFVVDEYQDVTPIQQDLLDAWLGGRDDLTVVGDANQTIYSFTGASPSYLLNFTRTFPEAKLVRLQRDYRSTPQVVDLANKTIARARGRIAGTRLKLVGQRADGPEPTFAEYVDEVSEVHGVVAEIKRLLRSGVPGSEIAVLYRVNAQSEPFEEALTEAGVEYRVRGDLGFFARPEIVAALRRLQQLSEGAPPPMKPGPAIRRALGPLGLTEAEPSGANARARWQQLGRLAEIAEGLAAERPEDSFAQVVATLHERARTPHEGGQTGVTLASMHAAKGLEWDAVLLTGLHEGSMPLRRASSTADEVEEERRLLYVGITRAREHLHLSWSLSRGEGRRASRKCSRFLDGLAPRERPSFDGPSAFGRPMPDREDPDPRVLKALTAWRVEYARENELEPANVVSKSMLRTLATALPGSLAELRGVRGMGADRIDEFGSQVLAVIDEHTKTAGRK